MRILRTAVWCVTILAAAFWTGCGDDDDDDTTDGADDDVSDDDVDDDEGDDDTWPPLPDDDSADDDTDDDDDTYPDDYVADWPQSNIMTISYDEAPAAGPLRQKADAYDEWHADWHQPGYGGNVHARFTDTTYTTIVGYQGWGDSCIWTGTYTGSEAYRYHVTGDADAKANVIRMIDVLEGYYRVTETDGFIARYWTSQSMPNLYVDHAWCEAQDRCHHVESGEFAGDFWWGETSRDQYTGWFYGMALAYDLVDDEAMRDKIRDVVADVLDGLIANQWTIIDEAGERTDAAPDILPPQQLSWATIGYHITGEERFKEQMQRWLRDRSRAAIVFNNIAFFNQYAQYYGNNLAHTNWFNLLRLGKVYYSPEDYAFYLDIFDKMVHTFTRLSHNPWFTGVYTSTDVYQPERDDPYVAQVIEDLTDFPFAPNKEYYLAERTGFTPDPVSVFLHDLQQQWPALADIMGEVNVQALDAFPVNEQCTSGFMFQRNPFEFAACGSDTPTTVNSGHDYLAAYWINAYLGNIDKTQ